MRLVRRRAALKRLAAVAAAALPLARSLGAADAASARSMIERPIPRTGERLPVVGLGTWQTFDVGPRAPERTELRRVLQRLVEHGGSVVDTSPMYGESERVTGDLVAELGLREQLFLATKVWTRGREAGIRQMETSFRLLRTTRMDMMQVHNLVDLETHVPTLREWRAAGRIRHIGITHYHAGAHRELERLVRTREFDFVQFNFSLAEREAEARLLPACADSGTAVLVNRPYAQGALFARVKNAALPPWAADFDCASWGQFFLKWILGHPAVTCVIPGTGRVSHVLDNVEAGKGRLPDSSMRRRMLEYVQHL
jgi:aryl-alcohol dehydrogenase-like predicted oxidoreductase